MTVRRIVANIAANSTDDAKAFYGDMLGMEIAMDLGWIVTFKTDIATTPQVSVATEGGSGTALPDLSIEVDNLDEVLGRMRQAGIAILYGRNRSPGAFAASLSATHSGGW